MTERKVESDPEVLYFAISDGINRFVREALINKHLVDAHAYDDWSDELQTLKILIARSVAESWKVATINDDDGASTS